VLDDLVDEHGRFVDLILTVVGDEICQIKVHLF